MCLVGISTCTTLHRSRSRVGHIILHMQINGYHVYIPCIAGYYKHEM